MPVPAAGHGCSSAPTERGIDRIAVVEATYPRSCDGVLVCWSFAPHSDLCRVEPAGKHVGVSFMV